MTENAESRIIDGPFRSNPIVSTVTRSSVGKKLANALGDFPISMGSISFYSFDFRRICKYGIMTKIISILHE